MAIFGIASVFEDATLENTMDLSDIGVQHSVAFTNLNIKHSFELSPSAVSVVRELRYCLIAIVVGLVVTRVTESILSSRKPAR